MCSFALCFFSFSLLLLLRRQRLLLLLLVVGCSQAAKLAVEQFESLNFVGWLAK